MKRFKIDDVAKETGLTKRTIRYYEEIGLIKPPKRSEKGTRLYSEEDIEQLKKVIAAREVLGFSLQELHHFLTLKEAIESHRFEYRNAVNQDEKKQELQNIASNLRKQIDMLKQKMKKMLELKNELEQLEQRIQTILQEEERRG
ncbi:MULTISPECIES: MerR family transcriptional regulator [Parageobacillus]|jgi:MerR family transcriptional regulator, repressor of the yfmOP operon|uniref:MerR family transcriptional regulator n=1 Tax=Parageobacillus thermoglucosidasius TaxID=1426 RepID=A0A1B7KMZ6_PARTM|nr:MULTISPECIES: MerR family transcriptional regulator [Parageobacillus]OAT71359.1 MerR family transcriptional regulator [Parageobacillus thermoglucosidasius]BDG48882.1 HTH-type transcriptional regulator YfmP [Parageobacillus sp. KH3-4]